jgi:hypothetical protein
LLPAVNFKRTVSGLALFAVLALFAANVALSWRRYDTVPSLAGFDEVMINDAALGVARFGEMRAPGLEGTPLGSIYSLFPPGFPLAQGAVIRVFGLTPLSLRFLSKIPYLLACVLGLLIVRSLWRRNVFSSRSAMVVVVLWLSDFAGFWIGRQARMESLEELFGLTAAWALLHHSDRRRTWWLAAALVGLAFCMHPSAIILWLPFLVGLWFFRTFLGWRTVAACASLPILILGALWLAVHRERSLEALAIFRTLNSYRSDVGFEWGRWTGFLRAVQSTRKLDSASLAWLKPIGGLSFVVVLAGWALIALRLREGRNRWNRWNRWVAFALACALAHILCAQFVTGVFSQRIMLYYPFALLGAGIALTRFGVKWERPALAIAVLIAVIQFATMFAYTNLPGDRSPDRYSTLPLPPGTRTVAGGTELWYYFASRNLPFRIVTFQRPMFADYWRLHPEHFDEFDAVILPEDDPTLEWPELVRRPHRFFKDYTGMLVICLKAPAQNPE